MCDRQVIYAKIIMAAVSVTKSAHVLLYDMFSFFSVFNSSFKAKSAHIENVRF